MNFLTFHNPRRGEMIFKINQRTHRFKLTLTALAYLEASYGDEDILILTRRFAKNGLSAKDVTNILRAGLYGAGEVVPAQIDLDEGFEAASRFATALLERAFCVR